MWMWPGQVELLKEKYTQFHITVKMEDLTKEHESSKKNF